MWSTGTVSQTIRVYLAATLRTLARLRDAGELAAAPGSAYAVTPGLPAQPGEDDQEELAYAAFRLAADASLALVRADPAAPRRRVVVSADVPAEPASDADEAGPVRLALVRTVPLAAVAAVHVDGAAAEPEVAAGDPAEHELEWYDVSELAQLLPA